MDNAESFHGSCYFHKHRGADTKIIFGPVWDFGNSYHRSTDKFIHQDPPYGQTWIAEIAKFPRFQARVKQLWNKFLDNDYASLDKFASDFAKQIAKAAECDANRWPNYGNRNMENAKNEFMKMLHAKVSWLKKQWGESGITGTEENALNVTVADGGQLLFSGNVDSATAFDLSGRPANIELTSPTTARIDGMARNLHRAASDSLVGKDRESGYSTINKSRNTISESITPWRVSLTTEPSRTRHPSAICRSTIRAAYCRRFFPNRFSKSSRHIPARVRKRVITHSSYSWSAVSHSSSYATPAASTFSRYSFKLDGL